jgi:NAD(P)-dependent dehydrogenase (short-subunit alcohol dehydrogenase family)
MVTAGLVWCRAPVASAPSHAPAGARGRLQGHVAVVTGGGRGIGRASAIRLAADGAKVAVISRSRPTVDTAVEQITRAGGDAIGATADVAERQQVLDALTAVVDRWGYVDILVNCAQGFGSREAPVATTPLEPLESTGDEVWDYTLRSGLWATLWTMRAAYPYMRDRAWGRVINFGSPAGQFGQAGNAPYNATKEAIRALTRTAAREWGKNGITANVVNPSARTDAMTAMFAQRSDEENRARLASLPIPRFGAADDVAELVAFLAGDGAAYITGETINVDSGLFLRP